MSGTDKCPSCGTAYIEHLGLIGTCKELQEALEAFSVVSRTSNEYLCQLTTAEISVKDYRAKNTMLREALEEIKQQTFEPWSQFMAEYTLHRTGGEE